MIKSFRDRDTEKLFRDEFVRRLQSIEKSTRRKLRLLNGARALADLAALPGNRLETLKGNRAGERSIRINDQWRICFVWREGHAFDVEIVDYH